MKVIDARKFSPQNQWQTIQSRIMNIWVRYPFLADRLLPLLWNNKSEIKKTKLKTAINSVIEQSILLKQDLELIWAVWFIKVFDIQISQQTAVKILRSGNDLAIIMILDILHSRNMDKKLNIQKEIKALCNDLKASDIDDDGNPGRLAYSEHWLLSYEAERENYFDGIGETFDILGKDVFFMKLLRKKIKFYDPSYMYGEDQFEKKRKSKRTINNKLLEYLTSPDFQAEVEQGNQEITEQFMKMIESTIEEY